MAADNHRQECAWCGTLIQEGEPPVSHGCCPDCYEGMIAEPEPASAEPVSEDLSR